MKAEYLQVTGSRHIKEKTLCEDVFWQSSKPPLYYYGLADGQSNKKYCKTGAEAALKALAGYIFSNDIKRMSEYRYLDEIRYLIIRMIRNALDELSTLYRTDISEFSSTILAYIKDTKSRLYMAVHLGDGCILGVNKEDEINMLSAPENGVFQNHTWLTTSEDALEHLHIRFGSTSAYNRIVMMTDGAECLCKGKNIRLRARDLLAFGCTDELRKYVMEAEPKDDATVVLINN